MSLSNYLSDNDKDKHTYVLRYYLPCEPIYDKDTIQRRCDELIHYCERNKILAVMLYVDLNPYWYYLPDNLEHTRYYVEILSSLAQRMRQKGISYQLNYQNLFGSWDGGADMRHVNGWENYVDQYGNESWGCGCSLGVRFREIAGAKLRLWAQTKPDIIWIDDDIRFHNHRTTMHKVYAGEMECEELDFGCFCNNHISMFNNIYGLGLTREQIHKGILQGGDLRRKWLDFSRECANELACWIHSTVSELSPDTTVALMSSVPDVHSVEGRHWGEFLSKLSGNKTPIVRAHFGPYCENHPRDFYDSYTLIEQLKENIRFQYDGDFEFCPEIENTRFTVWSKSLSATRYQLMLSAFLGCTGVTLSIYDLEGGVIDEYPEFADLLEETKPFCDSMAKMDLWNAKSVGVGVLTAPDRVGNGYFKEGVGAMQELTCGRLWDQVLLKCAFPVRYVTPDNIKSNEVYAVDGFTADLLTDDEIRTLLSARVIMDAGALLCLQRRGFAKYLGVTVGERISCIAASEVFTDINHADGSEMRLPIRIHGNMWNEVTLCGAKEHSRFVTPYGNEYTGTASFRNTLGGTVFIWAANGSLGDGFFSTYRIRWLRDIILNLSDSKLPCLESNSYALLVAKECGNKHLYFVTNMSSDKMNYIELLLSCENAKGRVIDMYGREHPAHVNQGRLKIEDINLGLYESLVCVIDK